MLTIAPLIVFALTIVALLTGGSGDTRLIAIHLTWAVALLLSWLGLSRAIKSADQSQDTAGE